MKINIVLFVLVVRSLDFFVLSQNTRTQLKLKNSTRSVKVGNEGVVTVNTYVYCSRDSGRAFEKDTYSRERTRNLDLSVSELGCPLTSYQFPRRGDIRDYIRLKTPIPDMYYGTVCTWVSTDANGIVSGTIISYATLTQFNSLVIFGREIANKKSIIDIYVNNIGQYTDVPFPKNKQSHLCVTFSVPESTVKIYLDGTLNHTFDNYTDPNPVRGGGVLIIGQEQDGIASGYVKEQSFNGVLTNLMMWDRELDAKEIEMMASAGCMCPRDYIVTLEPENIMLTGGVSARSIRKCPATK